MRHDFILYRSFHFRYSLFLLTIHHLILYGLWFDPCLENHWSFYMIYALSQALYASRLNLMNKLFIWLLHPVGNDLIRWFRKIHKKSHREIFALLDYGLVGRSIIPLLSVKQRPSLESMADFMLELDLPRKNLISRLIQLYPSSIILQYIAIV